MLQETENLNIEQAVFSAIKENTDHKGDILPGDFLQDDLQIDSFERLMIVNALEDQFLIEITEDDINNLKTVSDIIEGLKKYLPVKF